MPKSWCWVSIALRVLYGISRKCFLTPSRQHWRHQNHPENRPVTYHLPQTQFFITIWTKAALKITTSEREKCRESWLTGEYNKDHAWVEEMTSAEHQEAMKSNWWIREQKENVFFRQSWPTIIKEQPQDPRWESLMATGDLIKSRVTVAVFMCSRVSTELIRCNL